MNCFVRNLVFSLIIKKKSNMEMTRMIFAQKQPKVTLCRSGRAMVALNEKKVTTLDDVPGGMDDDGVIGREAREQTGYAYDVCWLDDVQQESEALGAAKAAVLAAIDAYDGSDSVNTLVVNGQRGWLDKATRVGLMNGVAVAKACGMERMSLWIDGMEYVMDVARMEDLLVKVEVYAMGCYNVTAGHRRAVNGMTTLEDVLGYDFKAGYPEKVSMEL